MLTHPLTICRIIGNELPPRDLPGSKLQSLEFICRNAEKTDIFWVLNRLIDTQYRMEALRILDSYGQTWMEIPFLTSEYLACITKQQKLHYITNINKARNFGIRQGCMRASYTACLDQDCFFTPALLKEVLTRLGSEAHYALQMKRVLPTTIEMHQEIPNEEPQLIFGQSPLLFDEDVPFGSDDKISLLKQLGCRGRSHNYRFATGTCETVGTVLHLSFSNPRFETNIHERFKSRKEALQLIVDKADLHYCKTNLS